MADLDCEKAAADGIDDAIRCMTVGIVSGSEEHFRHGLGTGSLVRWAGRSIVLTAEHVIRNTRPEDLGFFLRPNTPPKIVDRKTILEMPGVPTRELLPISTVGIRDMASDAGLDLAALVVDGELDGRHPAARFHELMSGGVTPQPESMVMSLGFPHDLMRTTHGNERVTFTYLEWSETVADREGLEEFDPAIHFLATFGEHYPEADPTGMSGSAKWFRKGLTPGIWHANIDIAGVTIAFYSKSRLTKNVRREAVEKFLTSRIT